MIYLCDTCVLIDYLRGKTEVQQKLEQDKGLGLGMSSITYFDGSRAVSGEQWELVVQIQFVLLLAYGLGIEAEIAEGDWSG